MGKRIHISRKDLKKDEVRSFWHHAQAWIVTNRNSLLLAFGLAALMFVGVAWYRQHSAGNVAEANDLLTQAQGRIYQALGGQSENPQAAIKAFSSAADQLETIRTRYESSGLAPQATYLLGNIAFFQHDYDRAINRFKEYIDEAKTPDDKADGYIALGYSYENKMFLDEKADKDKLLNQALDSYAQAEHLTSGTMQAYQAMLGRARIYDVQEGKTEEARKLYARIAAERKLQQDRPKTRPRSIQEMIINNSEEARRAYTLGETAKVRLDRLEAE
jgi:tetratricopeptide (TPR) repeat protein